MGDSIVQQLVAQFSNSLLDKWRLTPILDWSLTGNLATCFCAGFAILTVQAIEKFG
jgi:hypothetical protein